MNTATGGTLTGLPVSIPLTGANAGTDTIVAALSSHSLTSNSAEITWQPTNGPIALAGPVTVYFYPQTGSLPGTFPYTFGGLPTSTGAQTGLNSLMFNDPGTPGPNKFGWDPYAYPMYYATLNSAGTIISRTQLPTSYFPSGSSANYCMAVIGYFVVKTAGNITFNISQDDGMFFAIGPSISGPGGVASYVSGQTVITTSAVKTAKLGLALSGAHPLAGYNAQTTVQGGPFVVNFSQPGVYPFEFDYCNWTSGGGDTETLCVTTTYGNIPPTSLASAPPTGPVPTGQLQLTPTGGTAGLEVQGTVDSLQLSITGVPYTTIPYIPILEGVAGDINIYDSATSNVFNFGGVTYPENSPGPSPPWGVAPSAADALAANVVSLSGDNTAWQGLFTLAYSGTSPSGYYTLNYTGGSVASGVDVTNLTITAYDIAWYDRYSGNIDLFTASSGGVLQYPIQIAYMVMPVRSQITVSGGPLLANGTAQTLTINLPKLMSPEQQGLYGTGNSVNTPTASCSGGVTVSTAPTPVLNGNGWLTGWTMKVTVPTSVTSGSFQLTFGVTGTLTYLSGSQFTTGAVTYISSSTPLATIATTGNSYTVPTNYSFVVTGGIVGTTIKGSITLTATIFSKDTGSFTTSPGSSSFFYIHGSSKITLGVGTRVSGPTAVTGGYHTVVAITVTSVKAWGTPISLGYTATDSLSGLSFSYTDSISFTNGNSV
jgi:hypothetical protein